MSPMNQSTTSSRPHAAKGIEQDDFAAELAPDRTHLYPKEVAYIAKTLGVAARMVSIIDHPCGEIAIFVGPASDQVWYGYLDNDFYEALKHGRSFVVDLAE